MRKALVILTVLLGCNGAPSKGGAGNAGPPADGGADMVVTADDGTLHDSASSNASVPPDASPGSDASLPEDVSSAESMAYQEPAEIRGGACADPQPTTEACGGDGAQAVYCSLDDPGRVVMAVCLSSSRGSQCEAMDDCGPGWSACNATQYVERGGRDVQPDFSTTNRAWLAACVQDAGGRTLRNEPCAPCTDFDPAYDPAVMWWCDDGSVVYEGGMDGDRLGVVTSPECFRVGANSPDKGAWWALDFASAGPPFVVCCDDTF